MPKTIIEAFQNGQRVIPQDYDGPPILKVSECFSRTIQGEGQFSGYPATFLRLKGCTLSCIWCDTEAVWKQGKPYPVTEIVDMFEQEGVLDDFKSGHHLVITGGSPLLQQIPLVELLYLIEERNGEKPFVEVETECVLEPERAFAFEVDWWNCSPKLYNSGMKRHHRYKPEVIRMMARENNSSFKFVITNEDEWEELVEDFIEPFDIKRDKIFLMPEGQTREELQARYDWVVDLACREGVRVSDRLHITMWNKKVGV